MPVNHARRIHNSAKFLKFILTRGMMECRILGHDNRAFSGYFRHTEDKKDLAYLVRNILPERYKRSKIPWGDYPRQQEAKGTYFTLNSVNPDCYAAAAGNIKSRRSATSDENIVSYKTLLIDIDYHRPADISTTGDEKKAAWRVMRRVYRWLQGRKIEPVIADSGNGWHLLVFLPSYPNNPETIRKISKTLLYIADRFNSGSARIDLTVFNPSRIAKMYGTAVCKGDSLPERPHRYSIIHWRSDPLEYDIFTLLNNDIDYSSDFSPAQPSSDKKWNVENLRHVMQHSGFVFREKDKGARIVFEFEDCPLHTDPDGDKYECCVMVGENGQYEAKCQHDTALNWHDFKAVIKFDENKINKNIIPENIESIEELLADFNGEQKKSPPEKQSDVIKSIYDAAFSYVNFESIKSLIPSAKLFHRKTVSLLGGEPSVGKSTFMVAGILIPMLRGQPVLGMFSMPLCKTLYIQSDNDAGYFMQRIVIPYGYIPEIDRENLLFIHTKNTDFEINEFNLLQLIHGMMKIHGFEWVILDNRTSLFPNDVYGKNAQQRSIQFIDNLKTIVIKNNGHLTCIEHVQKPSHREWELLTLHNILGSAPKIAEQVIGLNCRYDEERHDRGRSTFHRRPGEGIFVPLKNIEMEKMSFNIVQEEPVNYLAFDSYSNIYETMEDGVYQQSQGIQSSDDSISDKVLNYIVRSDKNVFEYGEIMKVCEISRRSLYEIINQMQLRCKIEREARRGRGHKGILRVLDKNSLDNFYQKEKPLELLNLEGLENV